MKRILLASSVMCLGVFIVFMASKQGSPTDDEKEIWKNEKAYMGFFQKEDPEGVLTFWDKGGIGWPMGTPQPSGNSEARNKYLEDLFARTKVITFEIRPMAIKVFGDVAVVHYFVDWVSQDSEGNKEKLKTRITHTWMKKEGQWKIIGGMSAEE
jgi:ketosteroid isomerase-like protein